LKSILTHKLLIYIIPFLLGLFTSFSLPPYNFLIINFITFPILLLLLIYNCGKSKWISFKIGWLFGFGYFVSNLYWITNALTFEEIFKPLIPFALIFICLCFLFIINGSNLIDGFNGLLGIHSLIIFIVLFAINLINENNNLIYILFYISLLTLIFLKFNFPKAQIFLGDSGAYLIGILISISVIKTSILNPSISPFFFCILLFYLFFEVFFSFFRKLFVARQSPLLPDNQHLHMLLYKLLFKKNKTKLSSNYTVSIYINLIYLSLIIPGIIFMNNGLFCRYYFFSLLIVYVYFYKILYEKVK